MNQAIHPDRELFRIKRDNAYEVYVNTLRLPAITRQEASYRRNPLFGSRMDSYRIMLEALEDILCFFIDKYKDRPHEKRVIEDITRDAMQTIRVLERELRFHPTLSRNPIWDEYRDRIRAHWNTLRQNWYRMG